MLLIGDDKADTFLWRLIRVVDRRNAAGKNEDVTPDFSSGFNVRDKVHEYGGAALSIYSRLLAVV